MNTALRQSFSRRWFTASFGLWTTIAPISVIVGVLLKVFEIGAWSDMSWVSVVLYPVLVLIPAIGLLGGCMAVTTHAWND